MVFLVSRQIRLRLFLAKVLMLMYNKKKHKFLLRDAW